MTDSVIPSASDLSLNTARPEFFSFSQRIGRIRYLAYIGVAYLAMVPVLLLSQVLGDLAVIPVLLASLAYLVFGISLGIRRLHDLDKSGWWLLLSFIPVINFFMAVYLVFFPGSVGSNRYGLKTKPNTWVTWVLGLILPALFLLGVLAAVAIPAYQDYVERSELAQIELR